MLQVENFALNTGLKIDKPYIYDHYFPINSENFISLDVSAPNEEAQYKHWQKVITLIIPFLKKEGIEIIQVGTANDYKVEGIASTLGNTNANQVSYIVKRSKLHLCNDNLTKEFASFAGKDCVCVHKKHVNSKFIKHPNTKYIHPKASEKENINAINPEDIANSILKTLKIEKRLNFKTVHIGEKNFDGFGSIEMIPDSVQNLKALNIPNAISRMDLYYDEEKLVQQLNVGPVSIITNKSIKTEIIKAYKKNISEIVYIVEKGNDDADFCAEVYKSGIKFILVSSLKDEELQDKKLVYMDYSNIVSELNEYNQEDYESIKNKNNLYYSSSKILLSSNGLFFSDHDWKKGMKSSSKNDFQIFSSDENLIKNLHYHWVIQLKN
tara:strand:+ start:71 stop:1213 length:1143 start_codon:yes stop_codon:yes gene_type:complete